MNSLSKLIYFLRFLKQELVIIMASFLVWKHIYIQIDTSSCFEQTLLTFTKRKNTIFKSSIQKSKCLPKSCYNDRAKSQDLQNRYNQNHSIKKSGGKSISASTSTYSFALSERSLFLNFAEIDTFEFRFGTFVQNLSALCSDFPSNFKFQVEKPILKVCFSNYGLYASKTG